MSNDRFYVAAVSSTDARQAASQWLTTGLTRVAEASLSITACRLVYFPFAQFHSQYQVPGRPMSVRLTEALIHKR